MSLLSSHGSGSSSLKVVALGAGQDVGRSCMVVTVGGKNVMLDCGMHMGYRDERRFPDFAYLSASATAPDSSGMPAGGSSGDPPAAFDGVIDAVLISHFHLDHCGALPYFSEMFGYNGPIYMTYPTKAICPILLEDYRKIMVDRKGETNFFTAAMLRRCMQKVIPVAIGETVQVDDTLQIRAFYAGHVLGACMFWVSAGGQSVVYTGDYNMTPDRHLGAARIERLRPDLLITETTYATTIRDSKRIRERDFLKRTHRCVERGGKVLIPVFALGRAQELCILVETYWERMNLGHIPVYFSAGLTEKANLYYKLFISWTNEKIKSTFVERNLFDFRFIKPFERSFADEPGPMVLFATPGMLHAGTSLDVFKKWAPNPLNLVVIPGFCVVGTVGNRLLAGREHKGKAQRVVIDQHTTVDVRCKIKYLSFSAHADAKGIKQLIRQVAPRHVMLVHGEKEKMEHLSSEIEYEFGLSCYFPPNGVTINVPTSCDVPVDLSVRLITSHQPSFTSLDAPTSSSSSYDSSLIDDPEDPLLEGILLVNPDNSFQVVSKEEVSDTYGFPLHDLQRSSIHPIPEKFALSESELVTRLFDLLQLIESPFAPESSATTSSSSSSTSTSSALANPSRHGGKIVRLENGLSMGTVILDVRDGNATVTWKHYDQDLASRIIATVIAVISPESMKPSDSSSNTNNSSRSRPIDDNPKPPQPKLQRTR